MRAIVAILGLAAFALSRPARAALAPATVRPPPPDTVNPGSGGERVSAGVNWERVRHFSPGEFRQLDHLNPSVIYAADALRQRIGLRLGVSPVTGAEARFGGNPNSRHYAIGRQSDALDLLFIDGNANPAEVWAAALQIPEIGGFGYYPGWRNARGQVVGGIHIDTRPRSAGRPATWGGIQTASGTQYVSLAQVLA